MAVKQIACIGCKCPMPVLKLTQAVMKKEVVPGDQVELTADCPTFENDVKQWCTQMKKVLIRIAPEGAAKKAIIQI
jgi:tRNA 2-thiouridine synthesizing protein A